jgi:hypothetical protein
MREEWFGKVLGCGARTVEDYEGVFIGVGGRGED